MLNAFVKWIREAARAAIVEGVADGIEEVTSGERPATPRLAALAAKLGAVPALPAAAEPEGEPEKPAPKRGGRGN